jgi:hypothetical protein
MKDFIIKRHVPTTWDENVRDIEALCASLNALGISTVNSSRIGAYSAAFREFKRRANDGRPLDLKLAVEVLTAMCEFPQLKTILNAATSSSDPTIWKDRLARLVSGAASASDDGPSAAGRDFQFESYVGAVCALSGFDVRFAEPDLVVKDKDEVLGIAAKRPRSSKSLAKNLAKARKQIKRSRSPGAIAIDVTYALQANKCLNTNSIGAAELMVRLVADNFVGENAEHFVDLMREPLVLGAIVHLQMPVLNYEHSDGPALLWASRWTVAPLMKNRRQGKRWATDFCKKCHVGMFGPLGLASPASAVAIG